MDASQEIPAGVAISRRRWRRRRFVSAGLEAIPRADLAGGSPNEPGQYGLRLVVSLIVICEVSCAANPGTGLDDLGHQRVEFGVMADELNPQLGVGQLCASTEELCLCQAHRLIVGAVGTSVIQIQAGCSTANRSSAERGVGIEALLP